jgi:hypothetical protein
VLCLIYLSLLPFHVWGLGVLIATSALAVDMLGRPDDAITAAITTTVIVVVAAVSPAHAWEEPILRFVDTVVWVVVGVAAEWLGLRVIHPSTPGDGVSVSRLAETLAAERGSRAWESERQTGPARDRGSLPSSRRCTPSAKTLGV